MKSKPIISIFTILLFYSCEYSTETYKEGKLSYEFQCAPCHGMRAEGLGTLYPNLLHQDFIKENKKNISCWIHYGIGPDSTNAKSNRFSDQAMPPIPKLSDIEICNILNYLNAQYWKMEPFTIKEINENLATCKYSKNEKLQQEKAR